MYVYRRVCVCVCVCVCVSLTCVYVWAEAVQAISICMCIGVCLSTNIHTHIYAGWLRHNNYYIQRAPQCVLESSYTHIYIHAYI